MKKEDFIGKSIAIFLTISIALVFISTGLYGFTGVVKVGSHLDLIDFNLYPSKLTNVLYLGSLLIFINILLVLIEIIVRILMRSVAQSLKKNILSYMIQIVIGTVLIKNLIDNYFDRIEVSFLGVSISVFILYLIIFFSSGGHKGIDDLDG